jgi:TP901 family phage tail tape measure protein
MANDTVGRLIMSAMLDTGDIRRGVNDIKTQMGTLRSGVGAVNTAFRTLGMGFSAAAGVAAFRSLIRVNEEFKQSLYSSFAIMGDLSPRMKQAMKEASRNAAYSTRYSASEAAKTLFYEASAGLSPQQQIAAMPKVLQFAQAGMIDTSQAASILMDSLAAMGLASKDASEYMNNLVRVSDAISKANASANATVSQFGEALTNRGALGAKLMGYSIEEALAALMLFASKGIKGSEAGQQLWMVLRDLKGKAVENADAFKRLGIQVYDASGKARHLWDIIQDLDRVMKGKGTREQVGILKELGFSDRSLPPLQSLLGEASQLIENFNTLLEASGKTADIASKQMTPLSEGLHKMKEAFASIVDSGFGEWIDKLGTDMRDLADYIRQIPAAAKDLTSGFRGPTQNSWQSTDRVIYDVLKDSVLMSPIGNIKRSFQGLMRAVGPPENLTITKEMSDAYGKMIGHKPAGAVEKAALSPLSPPGTGVMTRREWLRRQFGPDRTQLQREFAFSMEGITNPKAQGLWTQWGAGKIDDKTLQSELQLLGYLEREKQLRKEITEQQKRAQQGAREAQSIRESMYSPFERLIADQLKAQDLMRAGHLSPDEYKRASALWQKDTVDQYRAKARQMIPDYSPVSAKTMGSAEAYSAIVQALSQSPIDRAREALVKQQMQKDKANTDAVVKAIRENQAKVVDFV